MSEKLIEHNKIDLSSMNSWLVLSTNKKTHNFTRKKKQKEFKFTRSKSSMQNKNKIHLFLLVVDNIFKI
jgi:hypothetical protein